MQQTSFNGLPLELRQAIYQYAAIDDSEDHDARQIRIQYTMKAVGHAEVGVLDSQALSTLETLSKISTEIWEEAVQYLTGQLFCWILVSDAQPHMYLLRALRKSVPKDILGRISHIRLLRLSVIQHTFDLTSATSIADSLAASAYLSRLGLQYTDRNEHLRTKVKGDVGYAITLLPYVFSALRRPDLNIELADALHMRGQTVRSIDVHAVKEAYFWENYVGAFSPLRMLRHVNGIRDIELFVLWDSFLGALHRPPGYDLSNDATRELQRNFVEALKTCVPAKSINCHP